MCCEERFARQLREQGLRLTPQREMVLHLLHDVGPYTTAEALYARVGALSSAVNLSTVYRTLELLEQFGLVASFDLGDGERRYELLTTHEPHFHLQCRVCGKLTIAEAGAMETFVDQLSQTCGFEVHIPHCVIPGICQECQSTEQQDLHSQVT